MRPIVLPLAVLLTAVCFRADGATTEPEEMSVVDLLTAMNAHFYKWSYQPEKPYTQLTFRFDYLHADALVGGSFLRRAGRRVLAADVP